jgi:hypothetical protein
VILHYSAATREAEPEPIQQPASATARDRDSAWTEARIAADLRCCGVGQAEL